MLIPHDKRGYNRTGDTRLGILFPTPGAELRTADRRALDCPQNWLNTIQTGDARQLSEQLPDESIDLIFTDPPYVKEQMHLYEWLSAEAARVLKPDGFLLAYVGNYWMFDAMQLLASHLTYYWAIASEHRQSMPLMWASWARNRYKTILVFSKHRKHRPRKQYFDLWTGGGDDKRFHLWGQDESTARYYIDCFSHPGST